MPHFAPLAPAQHPFCVYIAGFLRCSLRHRAIGRVVAMAALLAAAHAPAMTRAAEMAALDPSAVKRAKPLPAPLVRETYVTYDVKGASIPELRAGLRRGGVQMHDGSIYDALTSWDVRWEYNYESSSEGCSAAEFRANVDVTIRYPRWVSDDEAPASLTEAWDSYLQNLIRHEQGHRDIAVAAADAMTCAVSALPTEATCDDVDRAIKDLGRSYMNQLCREQQAYDTDTDHGAHQGAILP